MTTAAKTTAIAKKPAKRVRDSKKPAPVTVKKPGKNGKLETVAVVQPAVKVAAKKGSMLDAAKAIAAAPKVRKTATKVKAEPKRPPTDEATVNKAMKFFDGLVKKGGLNKVQFVRELALFDNKVLQRRDAFAIVAKHPELAIAQATVSTQFQFARSGKAKQNA